MRHYLLTLLLLLSCTAKGQFLEVPELPRPNQNWEQGFQERINRMWNTRIADYSVNPGDGSDDSGKRQWSRFLAKMALMKNENTGYASFIETGRAMINGANVGSFRKPFSCAGYAMYFFHWKDSIAKYDPAQIDAVYTDVNSMWHYLMRTDHLLDACCGYNAKGGKEFNSENFQWMLRSTGYLFAHELHQKNVDGQVLNMNAKSLSGIEVRTGSSSPYLKTISPENVNVIGYFDGYVKNLTRALYNAGRVEWNSNNYFGHTLNPLHAMYECADKCNDPNASANKKRAQACIDWMMLEAAVHYRDGFQVAADSRAKDASFLPFKGAYYQYTIPYFSDDEHYPSFGTNVWKTQDPGDAEIGFLTTSSYRPPNIIIDIAQRNFELPVEIQSAKPFYHIDAGTFFNADGSVNGESPYNDWNGTERGCRFEFETTYIGNRFTMASAAVGRPDGSVGTYSEQCMWRIGVDGQQYGARMLSGNAGNRSTTTGRYVHHEIGQYRNIMMQLVKSPSDNAIWIAVPDSLKQLKTSGSSSFWDVQAYQWEGNDLYVNMGNGVYLAVKPSSGATLSLNTQYAESNSHTKLTYKWAQNTLGALVIEVGEKGDYPDFNHFIAAAKTQTVEVDGEYAAYTGASKHNIRMEYVRPGTFKMIENTYDTPRTNPLSSAGNYPKVWGDGSLIDFMSWDSYRTVYGKPVVTQKWGSGELFLNTNNGSAKIAVNPENAEVSYFYSNENISHQNSTIDDNSIRVFPNPTNHSIQIESIDKIAFVLLYEADGRQLFTNKIDNNNAEVDLSSLCPGAYLVKLILADGRNKTYRILRV